MCVFVVYIKSHQAERAFCNYSVQRERDSKTPVWVCVCVIFGLKRDVLPWLVAPLMPRDVARRSCCCCCPRARLYNARGYIVRSVPLSEDLSPLARLIPSALAILTHPSQQSSDKGKHYEREIFNVGEIISR